MSVLSDREIRDLATTQGLIKPFDESLVGPATYDMRVGSKALRTVKEGMGSSPITNLESEKILQIGTGEFVEVLTQETVSLPPNICGRLGIRSYFTRKGLIPFVGLQVDPGFKGQLIISLFNTGPRTIVLKYGEPFCSVEFARLSGPAEKPYSGPYQNQNDFPSDNIEFIVSAKGITLYEVVEVMKGLRGDVKWLKWLLLAIFGALIAAILARII